MYNSMDGRAARGQHARFKLVWLISGGASRQEKLWIFVYCVVRKVLYELNVTKIMSTQ